MAPAWLSSTLGSPVWCQAMINCSYGLLCLTNDDAGYKVMYGKDDKPDKAALGMARFDGLELCKSGLILLASSDAPKSFRPTINGVVALNALADVGMTGADEESGRERCPANLARFLHQSGRSGTQAWTRSRCVRR